MMNILDATFGHPRGLLGRVGVPLCRTFPNDVLL